MDGQTSVHSLLTVSLSPPSLPLSMDPTDQLLDDTASHFADSDQSATVEVHFTDSNQSATDEDAGAEKEEEEKSAEAKEEQQEAHSDIHRSSSSSSNGSSRSSSSSISIEDSTQDSKFRHLSGLSGLGALHKETKEYVLPGRADRGASRRQQYICVSCKGTAVLRRGDINIPHFAHKKINSTGTNRKCSFYSKKSTESDYHIDAKFKLAEFLKQRRDIFVHWPCSKCNAIGKDDFQTAVPKRKGYPDNPLLNGPTVMSPRFCTGTTVKHREGDDVVVEHRGPGGKYVADVAVLNNDTVRYIFEIQYKHATTTEVRPEPWFEILTDDFRQLRTTSRNNQIIFDCIRNGTSRKCHYCHTMQEFPRIETEFNAATWDQLARIFPRFIGKCGKKEEGWKQPHPCVMCGTSHYYPVFLNRSFWQICRSCLVWYEKVFRSLLVRV